MTINKALREWKSKERKMGCVAATDWFCSKVADFFPIRISRFTQKGEYFEHVVASNGMIVIDLTPYLDIPEETTP